MKALFLGRYYFPCLGGGEIFMATALNHLQSYGHECIAACYSDPDNSHMFLPFDIYPNIIGDRNYRYNH